MVDALVSGTSVSDDVKVRVLSWAPKTPSDESPAGFRFIFGPKLGTLVHFSFHLNIFLHSVDAISFLLYVWTDVQIEWCADVRMTQ